VALCCSCYVAEIPRRPASALHDQAQLEYGRAGRFNQMASGVLSGNIWNASKVLMPAGAEEDAGAEPGAAIIPSRERVAVSAR
jgi:hypothetical protein